MCNLAESSESFRHVIFFVQISSEAPCHQGKSGKLPNNFQTLLFLFAICGKFQQSVAFLLHLLRCKAIDGHFANSLRYLLQFCNSLWYLLRFIVILQQFQFFSHYFAFYRFFPSNMGPHCRPKKNHFSPCFKHPPPGQAEKMSFSLFSDVEDHLEHTNSIKISNINPPPY